MKTKMLGTLAAVTALVAALALWLTAGREAAPERSPGEMLAPGLLDAVNEVNSIRITDAESGAVTTLELVEDRWTIAERGGYPAEVTDLRRGVLAFAEARLVEAKTANPDFYGRLGVEDPATAGASSRRIEVELPAASFDVIVGALASRGQTSTFVRRAGEAQSWAASGNLRLDADPKDWLERAILDLPTQTVRSVVITHPDGGTVAITKAEPGLPNFAVADVPEGRELLSPSAGNSIAGALASLRLEDVVARSDFDPGEAEPVRATFAGFDGRRATVSAWRVDDVRYVTVALDFDPALVAVAPDETGTDGADAESTIEVADAAAVADLASRLDGWVFAIPSYKHSNLTKRLDDLLKPAESPGTDAEGP
ncbi:MAG: DUF4340 domain-containing protein [Pseudomonadota bacterium]